MRQMFRYLCHDKTHLHEMWRGDSALRVSQARRLSVCLSAILEDDFETFNLRRCRGVVVACNVALMSVHIGDAELNSLTGCCGCSERVHNYTTVLRPQCEQAFSCMLQCCCIVVFT